MFTIPVWDILASYTGDSKKFSFSGPIPDGYFADLRFTEDLHFDIAIIALDDGVEVVFRDLSTTVIYEWQRHQIQIWDFERSFSTHYDPLEEMAGTHMIRHHMIDLAPILREELIMACHEL